MINLDNCRFVVWGFKNTYHTHAHIHEAFYRTLLKMGKSAQWLDHKDDLTKIDLSDTFFITEHDAAKQGMPIRDDCFYIIHGLNDDQTLHPQISHLKNRLSWNVYHDFSHVYGTQGNPTNNKTIGVPLTDQMWLDEDTPFYPKEKHMDFRWATDLVPEEIEKNKPNEKWASKSSKVINWVGTVWQVNAYELSSFHKACEQNGIDFKPIGAGQRGIVSIEENIRLVRESYLAPAIVGSHHITEGYAPCRAFKNISYGMMGITNSPRVNSIFNNKLIFDSDPYRLFGTAVGAMEQIQLHDIIALMDEVAKKHTYVNRIDCIMQAARLIMEE